MIVSERRSSDDQMLLWHDAGHKPIRVMAQTRNLCGDFFEQATRAASGAVRHKTDCRADVCPDLSWRDKAYFESKSVGQSGQSIVYLRRIAKDDRFTRQTGKPIYYWLWHHKGAVADVRSTQDLYDLLALTLCHCTIVPFEYVRDLCRKRPIKTLNRVYREQHKNRTGYNKRTYGRGWSVPLTRYAELCDTTLVHPGLLVAGVRLPSFPVRTVSRAAEFLLDYAGLEAANG